MKTYIKLLIQLIIIPFSYIFPKKDILLFGSSNGILFDGNPKYLFLYSNKYLENYKVFWVTENKNIYLNLRKKGYPVLYKFSFNGLIKILLAKFIFIDHWDGDVLYSYDFGLGKFNIIQTWHGTPLKRLEEQKINFLHKYFGYKSMKRYFKILSMSSYLSNILKKIFYNNNVIITGTPRNDIFFNKNLIFNDYSKYKKGYKKIFLYLPTFRDVDSGKNPFTKIGLKKLNNYLKNNNFIFYIKKHPFDKNLDIDLKDYGNIRDISGEIEDVQELLIYTDILITDYSSVIFDFMLTGKPIIYYSYDLEEYIKTSRGLYIDYYNDLSGPFAKTENELYDIIINIDNIVNNQKYITKYKEVNDKYNYYKDGKSCERVLKSLKLI